MPTFERLIEKPGPRDAFIAVLRRGLSEFITPLQFQVIALMYLGPKVRKPEEVGYLLEPPRTAASVRALAYDAFFRISNRGPSGERLSPREENAILRAARRMCIDPRDIAKLPDEDILGIYGLGSKALWEIREKIPS